MTREEIIDFCDMKSQLEPENEDIFNYIIKALEQEPILDKIRAEIEELDGKYVIGDYAIYGENTPKYVRLWNVLQIIDKYKEEREG